MAELSTSGPTKKRRCGKSSPGPPPQEFLARQAKKLRADNKSIEAATFLVHDGCCRASECGRICERLVKGPGKIGYCVDVRTGETTELYSALEKTDFACPERRF